MSTVIEAVDQARNETRSLYTHIQESTAKNHEEIRTDLRDAAIQAQRLASSLKTLASDRRTDEKQHLEHAALLLETAAAEAKNVASASAADMRRANLAMLKRTRDAAQAVAATRRGRIANG